MNNEPSFLPNPLPYDILREIFSHCVQQSSAQVLMQPNTKIAPMLLCHVCASWRAIVLSSPGFWSRLRFELPINWDGQGHPFTLVPKAFERRLEWIRWWRRNLGSRAPYLQVEERPNQAENSNLHVGLTESTLDFLFEFMSSAQYVSVGRLYQYLALQRIEAGSEVKILPNAHTIVNTLSVLDGRFGSYRPFLLAMLTETRATLRHLVIEDSQLAPHDYANPRHNWSALTHLSIQKMSILHLNAWFSFIRSLASLQSGSFHLILIGDSTDTYIQPTRITLPRLSVVHLKVSVARTLAQPKHLFKVVFDNLRLPALRTLSLESSKSTWDYNVITDVHAALLSAPAVTKLSLGFFSLGIQKYNATPLQFVAIPSHVEPLYTYAPQIEDLSFHLWSHFPQHGAFQFVENVFSSNRWLDLRSPTNTIRKVTIVSSHKRQSPDTSAENLLISEVRKFVNGEVSVVFQEEEPLEVQRAVWGW